MWIIYSAIPPLLLCVYRFLGRGTFLSWLCWLSFLVSSACGFLAILLLWNVYPAEVRLTLPVLHSETSMIVLWHR